MFSIISEFFSQVYLNFLMHAFIQLFNISMKQNISQSQRLGRGGEGRGGGEGGDGRAGQGREGREGGEGR